MNPANTNDIPDDAMIFALLLIISNKMNTLLEREFKLFGLTTKQWFLFETIKSLFDAPPTLKEVAKEMGSSYQNVKQVAIKLQQKGMLVLEKDKKDGRITRLRLTEQRDAMWNQVNQRGSVFRANMFREMDTDAIARTRGLLEKMLSNLDGIELAGMDETTL